MADIFLSYSKANRDIAAAVAAHLEDTGLTVWWDRHLDHAGAFAQEIETELDAARKVLVLWSPVSIASKWVRAEAQRADGAGKLICATISGLAAEQLPLPYNTHDVVDLGEGVDLAQTGAAQKLTEWLVPRYAPEDWRENSRAYWAALLERVRGESWPKFPNPARLGNISFPLGAGGRNGCWVVTYRSFDMPGLGVFVTAGVETPGHETLKAWRAGPLADPSAINRFAEWEEREGRLYLHDRLPCEEFWLPPFEARCLTWHERTLKEYMRMLVPLAG